MHMVNAAGFGIWRTIRLFCPSHLGLPQVYVHNEELTRLEG